MRFNKTLLVLVIILFTAGVSAAQDKSLGAIKAVAPARITATTNRLFLNLISNPSRNRSRFTIKTLGMISPFASTGRARIIPDGVPGKEY